LRGMSAAERVQAVMTDPAFPGAGRNVAANAWIAICEHLTAALRGWPVREIEHGVRLSEPQRVCVPRRDRAHPAGPHEDDAGETSTSAPSAFGRPSPTAMSESGLGLHADPTAGHGALILEPP
jgi:hypothetical protein